MAIVHRAVTATKWSVISQICTKAITPMVNIMLARILAPEAFGIIATITMVTSFADLFADAGFQRYLIQHEFKDNEEKNASTTVAFWINLGISGLLWLVILVFNRPIAQLVGNPGLGHVMAIACIQLPLTSFSSMQMALFRRNLDFKSIFFVQIVCTLIPLLITVPLALIGMNYWSIIIGNICSKLLQAIIFTMKSLWKPSIYFNFSVLKKMLSFSIWTLLESISVWLISWLDAFIISNHFSTYLLGIYKSSQSMVNALMDLVIISIIPILFASLSRLQNDEKEFTKFFLKVQKQAAYILFPMGAGILLYRNFATLILFGSKWIESGNIVGIWAFTSAIRIVLCSLNSEVYRAKGKPKVCLVLQTIDLLILVPTCLISIKFGFWSLVYARSFERFLLIIPGLSIISHFLYIKPTILLLNMWKPAIFTICMSLIAIGLQSIFAGNIWNVISIVICIFSYIFFIKIFASKDAQSMIAIVKLMNLFEVKRHAKGEYRVQI